MSQFLSSGFPVSGADVAAFTAGQVDDHLYIGRATAIRNYPKPGAVMP